MTARRRRLVPILAAATTAALALSACSGGQEEAVPGAGQEVKIGLLAPDKGSQKGAGDEARRGAQLAADVINGLNPSIELPLAEGAGLPDFGGAKVRIVAQGTSGAEAQTAAAGAVTRLISQEGVDALVGAFDSEVTEYASQRSERFEVPFVNADSPATYLTDRGSDWFFRLGPSWRTAGQAFFSLLRQQQGPPPSIVVLHPDDKSGRDVNTTITELAEQGGYTGDLENVAFSATAQDLGSAVRLVRQAGPDIVMVYATSATVQPLVQAFAQQQYRPKGVWSFGLGYLTTENYRQSADAVAGLARTVSWSPEAAERNPAARAIKGLYQRKFNTDMTEEAAASFTAVMTVAQAINEARSTDPARVRSALLSLDVPGEQTIMPWGGVQFDETHQNVRAQVLVEQFLAGEFKIVYPRDATSKGRALVYPANDPAALTR